MSGLLLDQNLSFRLLNILKPHFPESVHVGTLRLNAASDSEIWDHARRAGLAILSKDSDFHHLGLLTGGPPKVIWLKIGNASTSQIAILLQAHVTNIQQFLDEDGSAFYVLGP